jgi:type I restriction enzyme, S subunit
VKAGWSLKPLNEVCDRKPSKGEARRRLVDTDNVSFLPMNELGIHQKYFEAPETRPLSAVAGSYTYFAEGDVLLAKITPCFENGKLGIAQGLENGIGFGSSEFMVLRPKPELCSEYLYYFLDQESFREVGAKAMTGAVGHKRIPPEFVEALQIPLPPLEEQRQIVAVLDKAFSGIATATANVQKNLTNARAIFESYLGTAFDRDEVAWTSYRLGETALLTIIDGDRGTNYPNKSDFLETGHCLFLNTKNVRPDGFNFDTTMFVSEQKDDSLRKGKLSRGDVIMTTRGTIGNLAVYDETVAFEHVRINSGMLILRPNPQKISPSFLFEILRSGIVKKQIAENVSGAAQPQLPIHTLVKFTMPVPNSLTDQKHIVEGLAEIETATNNLERLYGSKLVALSELKQSLLQKAFAGELT